MCIEGDCLVSCATRCTVTLLAASVAQPHASLMAPRMGGYYSLVVDEYKRKAANAELPLLSHGLSAAYRPSFKCCRPKLDTIESAWISILYFLITRATLSRYAPEKP